MTRFRKRRDEGGAAAVEFALVLIPMLFLIFGLIQYGWYFYAMQAGSSAVGDASRRVAVGNCQTVGQVQTLLRTTSVPPRRRTLPAPSPRRSPTPRRTAPATSAPGEIGGSVTVTATFPTLNMHFPFIPVPGNGNVTRTNVARIEDLGSTQGTCS